MEVCSETVQHYSFSCRWIDMGTLMFLFLNIDSCNDIFFISLNNASSKLLVYVLWPHVGKYCMHPLLILVLVPSVIVIVDHNPML